MITVRIKETAAAQLAQFCKRAFFQRVKVFASNETETCLMTEALEELRAALEEQGFSPR
jgi:hypothetical protein